MPAANPAFASFEQKWLSEFPENMMAGLFLPATHRQRASAFGSLIHELTQTAFYRSEAQIASTKLGWWRQELIDAHAGSARHPVTAVLFADAQMRASDRAVWSALADNALAQIDRHDGSGIAQLMQRFRPWHASVARAQATVFSLQSVECDAEVSAWTISHLLHDLARIPTCPTPIMLEQVALPLDLLARHAILRKDLIHATAARKGFVGDYLGALLAELDAGNAPARVRSLPQRVRCALDRQMIVHARRATDPLQWLAAHKRSGHGRNLWTAWRQARRLGLDESLSRPML